MQKTGKPFLVIINSQQPEGDPAKAVRKEIQAEFGIAPMIADCQALDAEDIKELLKQLLYSFPMQALHIHLPRWMDALEADHPVKASLYEALVRYFSDISTLAQADEVLGQLRTLEAVQDYSLRDIDLATGTVCCSLNFPEELFYEILSSRAGMPIENDAQLLSLLTELSQAKAEYDKISDALSSAKATGYCIVMPDAEEMTLESPEVVRKGGAFGVKLKAGAPSIHMIRVDIDTEISPMVGGEQQSQDLISYLSSEDPEKLWQSNIFGKSVYNLIQDGLTSKLIRTPADVQEKFRGTLSRVVNEGANGLICLII
jgi:stage IV sporulation protein A